MSRFFGSGFAIPWGMTMPSTLSILASAILAASCASDIGSVEPNGGGGGGGGGGPGGNGADAGAAPSCDEVRPITVQEALPADLLLVVDKSGSMKDSIGGQQKWAVMRGALQSTLTSNAQSINFGLMLYPANDSCSAGNVLSAIAPANTAAVSSALQGVNPEGGTPTHTTLQSALSYYQGISVNSSGRYVLLATDGEPNCRNANDPSSGSALESIAAVAALKSAGIPTFVLGFGDGVNALTLQAMAVAGGQNQYYAANSPAQLQVALDSIADQLALPDCSFVLGESPSDPTRLRVFFDTAELNRSGLHTEGWDYDAVSNSVTVYGASCTQLQAGSVGEVRVDYGCEGPAID